MIEFDGKTYTTEKRLAKVGELIQTTVFVVSGYPAGSILRVHDEVPELNEIIAYPPHYVEGMNCFGYVVFLEQDDYKVMVETK